MNSSITRTFASAAALCAGLALSSPSSAATCTDVGGQDLSGTAGNTSGNVCFDFLATVTIPGSGPYSGATGSGYFTFDASALPGSGVDTGNGNLFAEPLFPGFPGVTYDFALDIFGQTFTDTDSPFASLNIDTYIPIEWVAEFSADVINDPNLSAFRSIKIVGERQNLFGDFSTGPLTVSLEVEVIPLPAGFWLLGAGLAGLGAVARYRRRHT